MTARETADRLAEMTGGFDLRRDAIEAALADAYRRGVESRPKVKPLEWVELRNDYVAQPESGPVYVIERFYDEWDLLIDGCHTKPYVAGIRETYKLEAAKAAAQADYEARILSALDLPPRSPNEQETET